MAISMGYEEVYDALQVQGPLREVISGRIALPTGFLRVPFEDFGFPPACVPLWSEKLTCRYAAIWKHWFSTRSLSYVTCDTAMQHLTWEVARTSLQLLTEVTANFSSHERISDAVKRFAQDVGIDFAAVQSVMGAGELYCYSLARLPWYASNPPLVSYKDERDYGGDFPSAAMPLTPARMMECCTLEMEAPLFERISTHPDAPPWFKTRDQSRLFRDLLSDGDLQGAWMCLNSRGWTYADAKSAIQELARVCGDPAFAILAEAWCARPHERYGNY